MSMMEGSVEFACYLKKYISFAFGPAPVRLETGYITLMSSKSFSTKITDWSREKAVAKAAFDKLKNDEIENLAHTTVAPQAP